MKTILDYRSRTDRWTSKYWTPADSCPNHGLTAWCECKRRQASEKRKQFLAERKVKAA